MTARRGFEYGLLDIAAKKEIWRSCLKALAIPGYQVPFSSREMPIARGFGTGGLQITLSLVTSTDKLKVIDQGADECVNACSIRDLVAKVAPGVQGTVDTREATLIQTRHRIPETPLEKGQILTFQVPFPDPLGSVEPYETRRVEMHGETDYSRLYVVLYENVVAYGEIQISSDYPTRIHDHAIPPFTSSVPLDFEDVSFTVEKFRSSSGERFICSKCGAENTFLDEFFDLDGNKHHSCSDTEYCDRQQALVGGRK